MSSSRKSPNEAEANGMIGVMKDEGLEVFMEGGPDMPLFGEEVGDIPLIANRDDFEKATALLKETEDEIAEFDWSDGDVGELED